MIDNLFYKPYENYKESADVIVYYRTLKNQICGIKICFDDFEHIILNCLTGQSNIQRGGLFSIYLENSHIDYVKICEVKNKKLSINELRNFKINILGRDFFNEINTLENIKTKLILVFSEAYMRDLNTYVLFSCSKVFKEISVV